MVVKYKLFELGPYVWTWGISPPQWGIDFWPKRLDDDQFSEMYNELIKDGVDVIGSLIYFDTIEDRTGFIYRWLL